MKYFELNDKPCRALNFDKDRFANDKNLIAKNVVIKGLPLNGHLWILNIRFADIFKWDDAVIAAKVALNADYSSRKYGFWLFKDQYLVDKAIELGPKLGLDIRRFNPKDRREKYKIQDNIYVKNFPYNWDET